MPCRLVFIKYYILLGTPSPTVAVGSGFVGDFGDVGGAVLADPWTFGDDIPHPAAIKTLYGDFAVLFKGYVGAEGRVEKPSVFRHPKLG